MLQSLLIDSWYRHYQHPQLIAMLISLVLTGVKNRDSKRPEDMGKISIAVAQFFSKEASDGHCPRRTDARVDSGNTQAVSSVISAARRDCLPFVLHAVGGLGEDARIEPLVNPDEVAIWSTCGTLPLAKAAYLGHHKIVQALLKAGAFRDGGRPGPASPS